MFGRETVSSVLCLRGTLRETVWTKDWMNTEMGSCCNHVCHSGCCEFINIPKKHPIIWEKVKNIKTIWVKLKSFSGKKIFPLNSCGGPHKMFVCRLEDLFLCHCTYLFQISSLLFRDCCHCETMHGCLSLFFAFSLEKILIINTLQSSSYMHWNGCPALTSTITVYSNMSSHISTADIL